MSVSSNSRKESTESYAAQQMHNTMGIAPELAQLNDKNLDNDLPSRVADSNDTDVPGDYQQAEVLAAEGDDAEAKGESASVVDSSNSMGHKVADADWNTTTEDGAIPAKRADEPDRTLGNS
ncbi:MAG: hypothetical protein EOO39_30310 [Cytophagaceae bacterium]|nr:MAG: hypothetical protein EOO39_30310 [Cytophagaceae bacterium]